MLLYSYTSWERLTRQEEFVTDAREPQDYDLPNDFAYMLDQTGWMRDENVPLMGPLSAQEWQYLIGRDLVSSTIYASFRINEGMLKLFPTTDGIKVGENIAYEYMSKNWVQPAGETDQDDFASFPTVASDIVLFQDPLPSLALKCRFLAAKGMDTTKADAEYSSVFLSLTGQEKSAPILRAAGGAWGGWPLLNAWRNVPDTHYGGV
jgi:hypothetical protein